jgi:hypothetical protein
MYTEDMQSAFVDVMNTSMILHTVEGPRAELTTKELVCLSFYCCADDD